MADPTDTPPSESVPERGPVDAAPSGRRSPRTSLSSIKTPRFLKPLVRRPQVSDRVGVWLVLGLILLLASPVLFLELHRPDVTDAREAQTLATAAQTFDRQSDLQSMPAWTRFSGDYWTPTYNGALDMNAPPATIWLEILALDLSGREFHPQQCISVVRAGRTLSAIMGLVVIAAVYWAGLSIGGTRTAWLSAMVCATNPLLLWYARLATPEIIYAGWALISIAAALWALRPLRPSPTVLRQALGWLLCGLAMGMACLSAGPGAIPAVTFPILLFVILCPNRSNHSLGLVASLLIAVLWVMPWAVYAHQQMATAWPLDPTMWIPAQWLSVHDLFATALARIPWLFGAILPWLIWLPGAVIQPFSTSSAGVRVRMFLGWSWFLVAAVICLGATDDGWRACLVLSTIAASVLIAQVFHQYIDRSAEGRPPRTWRVLRWPHVLLLLIGSVIGPWLNYAYLIPGLHDLIPRNPIADFGFGVNTLICLGLLGLVLVGFRWAVADFPSKAMIYWGVWGLAFNLGMLMPVVHGPLCDSPVKADGLSIASYVTLAGNHRIFWLDLAGPQIPTESATTTTAPTTAAVAWPSAPDPQLVFYVGAPLNYVQPQQLSALEAKDYYILAPVGGMMPNDHTKLDWHFSRSGLELWRVSIK